MLPSPAIGLESEVETQFGLGRSSSSLKLFTYSLQAEFHSGSAPFASEVFRNLDLSVHIANFLSPQLDPLCLYWFGSLNSFSRVCTATFPAAVTVLYRNIPTLSLLWSVLIDRLEVRSHCNLIHDIALDPTSFLDLIDEAYGPLKRDLAGEDARSYKFRRFLFICSRVQTLWTSRQSFTTTLSAFFMGRIPCDSQYLFPALTKLYWIEKDRTQPTISLRTSPIELLASDVFRPTALRFFDIELHDMSAPLSSVLGDKNAISRIWEFIGLLGQTFLNFYVLNLCVCRPDCGTHRFMRTILNNLNAAVLKTGAAVISSDIPTPFSTFNEPLTWMSNEIKENVTIDVVSRKGRTFFIDPKARDYYPTEDYAIMTALTTISCISFALSYHTNMDVAYLPDVTILDILEPYFGQRDLQFVTVHLESVLLHLPPFDIVRVGANWRHLHQLDLRFQVLREKPEAMPTVETVRLLTTFCPVLEYLYLPDLNVLGFGVLVVPGVQSFSLTLLTSFSLLSCESEASELASALLSMFPNLTDVMIEGISAHGWDNIAKAITDHTRNPALKQDNNTASRLAAALVAAPITEEELRAMVLN